MRTSDPIKWTLKIISKKKVTAWTSTTWGDDLYHFAPRQIDFCSTQLLNNHVCTLCQIYHRKKERKKKEGMHGNTGHNRTVIQLPPSCNIRGRVRRYFRSATALESFLYGNETRERIGPQFKYFILTYWSESVNISTVLQFL